MKEALKDRIEAVIISLSREWGVSLPEEWRQRVKFSKPPSAVLADFSMPVFPLAPFFKKSPVELAAVIAEKLRTASDAATQWHNNGPYLNIKVAVGQRAEELFQRVEKQGKRFGHNDSAKNKAIMIEFSCPNTNKPLHLGHLRNDAIGNSVAQLLKATGANVKQVNLINDRGVHICKSMLAYRLAGNSATPQQSKQKSDHFVGSYYVKFNQLVKENPELTNEAQKMLQLWEADDPETRGLWRKMNEWAIDGIKASYRRCGITFDKYYYESETYALGREIAEQGLAKGLFYKRPDGAIAVDLSDVKLDEKVILRGDGTSIYLTQDLGTAVSRYRDWPFETLIFVVASEQRYHFKVLFETLKRLGYDWAANLHHLAYGMVNLPDGRMKSREGNVVDADTLLDQLTAMARQEIIAKNRENEIEDIAATSEAVALGALNYYLLQVNPNNDMIFNPDESISFNGNTGPYIQYTGARICSLLRKYRNNPQSDAQADYELLTDTQERELINIISNFPVVTQSAAAELNPSLLTAYVYRLARTFSRYYHETPIIAAEKPQLAAARVELAQTVAQVLQNSCSLLGIPFLEKM